MASAINSDNGVVSGTAGLKSSADSSGVLDLQTNGTTAISISASQVVSFANQPTYTGGTANGVMFLNGSKVVTTGSALTFDGANLGVGTASPDDITTNYTTVDVRGSVGGGLRLGVAGGNNMAIYASATTSVIEASGTSALQFVTNAAEQMRLTSTGLGIGTSSPSVTLELYRDSASASGPAYPTLKLNNNNAAGYSGIYFYQGVNYKAGMEIKNDIGSLVLTNVSQIEFPATQVASANANTLDDYEEGTWTPTIIGSTTNPTITYSTQNGKYTKIGRVCYFMCQVAMSSYSGGSGRVLVTGLPFTAGASGIGNGALSNTLVSYMDMAAGYSYITNYVDPSTTNFNWLESGDNVAYRDMLVGQFQTATTFIVSGFYIVA